MTLKRKCAQRSCARGVDEVAFIRCDMFVVSTVSVVRLGFYATSQPLSPGILCARWRAPHITRALQVAGGVIGARNRSSAINRWRCSTAKLRQRDRGIAC